MAPEASAPTPTDLLSRLAAVLDEVTGAAGSGCLGGDEVAALSAQLSRLESAVGSAASSLCAAGGHREEGARSAAVWLSLRARLSRRRASSLLRCGSVAASLPEFASAWSAGAVSGDHLGVLSPHLACPRTRDRLEADEGLLCDLASSLSFAEFSRALAYWAAHADPGGSSEAAEARRCRRDVSLVPSFAGTFYGRMVLDPVSGEIVVAELDRLEAELFDDDVAEARERLGRDPEIPSELSRTPAQRRADALVLMAARSALVGDTPVEARPLLTVLVDAPTLFGRICETEGGVVLDPSDLDGLLTRALVERAVFSAPEPGGGLPALPAVPGRDPTGRRGPGPELSSPPLRGTLLPVPGGPCGPLRRGGTHHPGQRAPAVRVPQPPAQHHRGGAGAAGPARRGRGAVGSERFGPQSRRSTVNRRVTDSLDPGQTGPVVVAVDVPHPHHEGVLT